MKAGWEGQRRPKQGGTEKKGWEEEKEKKEKKWTKEKEKEEEEEEAVNKHCNIVVVVG